MRLFMAILALGFVGKHIFPEGQFIAGKSPR